jgi:N6-adenosine-specific RNA methylase IME4/ParB-like chromosome segregation protein Spo0J
VRGIAESIKLVGLLNPISIDQHGTLIAGAHRLAAHKLLRLLEIECVVLNHSELQGKLAEIDENLVRNDLDAIGIGEQAILRDEILDLMGLRKKPHGNGSNQHVRKGAGSAALRTTQDVADEIGLSKRVFQENRQLARDLTAAAKAAVRRVEASKQDALKLARKSPEEQEIIAEMILTGKAATIVEAVRAAARDTLRVHLESTVAREVKATEGVYDVIVVDPPWCLKMLNQDEMHTAVGLDYPTMTEEELLNLTIPAAADCHLWMWAPQRFLPVAFHLLEVWGFKYSCTFVWHKRNAFQPFRLPKFNCEFAIYARKGDPHFIDTKNFITCFEAPTSGHSEKPEKFYEVVRRVTAGRRLDMFNRRKIEGFDTWGNEAK